MTEADLASDLAEDEELSKLYDTLLEKELACEVHDEDFLDPLSGSLKFSTSGHRLLGGTARMTKRRLSGGQTSQTLAKAASERHMHRHHQHTPLSLECEDRSVNMRWPVEHLCIERKEGADGTSGLALMLADGEDLRVVLFQESSIRDCLESVLHHIQQDPRGFKRRRRQQKRATVSCACVPRCSLRPQNQRKPASNRGMGQARHSIAHSKALKPFRVHARESWDSESSAAARPSLASHLGGALSTRSHSSRGHRPNQSLVQSPPTVDRQVELLLDLLFTQTDRRALQQQALQQQAASLLPDKLAHEIGYEAAFNAFWETCVDLLLLPQLIEETALMEKLEGLPHHPEVRIGNLEWYSWFLVKQDEPRNIVEKAKQALEDFHEPDVIVLGEGSQTKHVLTMFGLARYLCSNKNMLFNVKRCDLDQDMSRPLSEYWISTLHHVFADPPPEPAGPGAEESADLTMSRCNAKPARAAEDEPTSLDAFQQVLSTGCRCISLALTSSPLEQEHSVQVLLGSCSLLLVDVLLLIDKMCFQDTGKTEKTDAIKDSILPRPTAAIEAGYPVLLVLSLARLQPTASAKVPKILKECLGERLWAVSSTLPSPEEARGKIVVILAPSPDSDPLHMDMSLYDPAPPLESSSDGMRRSLSPIGVAPEDAASVWEKTAASKFAVWGGYWLDAAAMEEPPANSSVGFVPSDDLQAQTQGGVQVSRFVERHHTNLALAFPVMPRTCAANFNPSLAWGAGVQMVALALSGRCTDGAGTAHAARFAYDNGGCGYVLKPPHLRGAANDRQKTTSNMAMRLDLRVVAARAIPGTFRNRQDPSQEEANDKVGLSVSIWGSGADCGRRSYTPVTVQGPVVTWPESSTTWPKDKGISFTVQSPSVAVLVLEVFKISGRTGQRSRVACFGAPVDALRSGYRWVPMWEPSTLMPSLLDPMSGMLVHVTYEVLRRRGHTTRPSHPEGATPLLGPESMQRAQSLVSVASPSVDLG